MLVAEYRARHDPKPQTYAQYPPIRPRQKLAPSPTLAPCSAPTLRKTHNGEGMNSAASSHHCAGRGAICTTPVSYPE